MPGEHSPPAAWLDSYHLNLRDALQASARQGYSAVVANAATDELDPSRFADSARRHLRKYLRDLGSNMQALAVDFPGLGLADPRHADQRVERVRGALELAADLGVHHAEIRIAGLGAAGKNDLARAVLTEVARMADRHAAQIAVLGGGEDPAAVAAEIARLNCPNVGLALDTGDVAWSGVTPPPWLSTLAAVQLRDTRGGGAGREEVPFGRGQVDFPLVLGALAAAGYRGPLIIRRDSAPAAGGGVDAMRQGLEYIDSLLRRAGGR